MSIEQASSKETKGKGTRVEMEAEEVVYVDDRASQRGDSLDGPTAINLLGDLIGKSTVNTFKAMHSKSKMDNVAIFVDYDNVYWSLTQNHSHHPNHLEPEKNLFDQLWNRYGKDKVRTFRAYADFEKIKTDLTSLQKKRVQLRHVYSNGKDVDQRKNSSDIELCIDAIEHTYKDPNTTCYVIVTADSDMIPVISRLVYKGIRVELYYTSDSAPKHVDITTYPHYSEDLLKLLNVDVKTYEVEGLIDKALLIINSWHAQFKETELYLGSKYLKKQFTMSFGLPTKQASELLERLEIQNLITTGTKYLSNGEAKKSIILSQAGKVRITPLLTAVQTP
ncbi:NYN domain-containing protein [Paenibacillus popilliae]|nr:NYN domain-containing protein [Paenibacillus popilliae]